MSAWQNLMSWKSKQMSRWRRMAGELPRRWSRYDGWQDLVCRPSLRRGQGHVAEVYPAPGRRKCRCSPTARSRDNPVGETPQVHLFAADFPAFVLNTPAGFQDGNGAFALDGLAKEYAILNMRSLVFAHFFSGFRRRGDLHDHLNHQILEPGLELHVISVDLCLQKEQGNLLAHGFWQRQIATGQVIGAGPPCETFSAARLQGEGPRVNVMQNTLTDFRRCATRSGTRCSWARDCFTVILDQLLLLALCGGCGFCEHPQFPVWLLSKEAASIWAHPAVRALRLLRCWSIT